MNGKRVRRQICSTDLNITQYMHVGVVIHICIETTQGNSLCSYLYLKLAKTSHFSFDLFSSTKSENRRVKHVL
jgi:hypothetical protein